METYNGRRHNNLKHKAGLALKRAVFTALMAAQGETGGPLHQIAAEAQLEAERLARELVASTIRKTATLELRRIKKSGRP
jgi:2-methylcitrate dehydratase PrpD